jgi:hypothetical protein
VVAVAGFERTIVSFAVDACAVKSVCGLVSGPSFQAPPYSSQGELLCHHTER